MLQPPEPVIVLDLFPPERAALLALLESLPADAWEQPTSAGDWTVKDVAAHLVADDLGRLSRQRDGYKPQTPRGEPLKTFIDRINAEWVGAMHRLSPLVVRTLLEVGGQQIQALFESIDPFALGSPVSWAGPGPAPNWLDLAREFTERWHHQQQIREAVGAPILDEPRFLRSVLATFAFALVPPFRDDGLEAPPGTTITLSVQGPSGGDWTVLREPSGWSLQIGRPDSPAAVVAMNEGSAWRMYVRALSRPEVAARSTVTGDARLGGRILDAFALLS